MCLLIGQEETSKIFPRNHLKDSFKGKVVAFLIEFLMFLTQKKKLWLAPIILTFLLVGALLLVAQGTAVGPLIYTLF